jgi:CheY-like chemotaxis protein
MFEAAERDLDILAPKTRQAFLLVTVETFPPGEAATVLGVSGDELQDIIDEAGREIAKQIATDVVIVEDEPLIALDLVQLVTDLGHRVVMIARTETQAVEAVRRLHPGLIMADVQLADGSSGLEAVNEILRSFLVPVIFVTAYPARLLTGTRPEPTFLITKPFSTENLKAVISQALFFDIRSRPAPYQLATVG